MDARADVMLIDDGSTQLPPETMATGIGRLSIIQILHLRRNIGHQRAICIALCHLREFSKCTRVLVMDGDGEDDPADIPRLSGGLDASQGARIVFAERTKRSEGWRFVLFYRIYLLLHRVLVGHHVRVGNFSMMTRECLESICVAPELWNHYAACAFATRQVVATVSTNRAKRLRGESKMNFPALVMHGLSALSVFSDRIFTKLLILSAAATAATVFGLVVVTLIRVMTDYAIPGWATSAFGILLLLLLQLGTFIFNFCFLVLLTRSSSPFIPLRDYKFFILRITEVERGEES